MPKEPEPHIPCHSIKIGDEEWVHIPGCWAAIHDPACCTCYERGSELEEAIRGRREAEMYIERLQERAAERAERLNQMFSRNRRLYQEIERLESLLQKQTD